MLAPKQFDPVNRDLEIRDLYNMEDAFQLARATRAYRARLNANLAFWDGLDGKTDWPTDGNGTHPLTELVLADFLVVDLTKPYAEQGSFFGSSWPPARARAPDVRGRALNDDVMDTMFTLLVNAGNGPRIRDGVDQATKPAAQPSLTWRRRTRILPSLPSTSRNGTSMDTMTAETVSLELDDIQSEVLHERPSPYVGTLLLRIDDRAAGRELVRRLPVVDAGRPASDPARGAWVTVAFTYHGPEGAGRAAGLARQLRPEFRQGMAAARPSSATSARAAQPTGKAARNPDVHVALAALSPDAARLEAVVERAAAPTRSCPASR